MIAIRDASGSLVSLKSRNGAGIVSGDTTPVHEVSASALPAGAAEEATLQQAVDALTNPLPLPTGAASEVTLAGVGSAVTSLVAAVSAQADAATPQPVKSAGSLQSMPGYDVTKPFAITLVGPITGTAQTVVIAAPGSGNLYLAEVDIFNTGGTASLFYIRETGDTTNLFQVFVPAGQSVTKNLPALIQISASKGIDIIAASNTTYSANVGTFSF